MRFALKVWQRFSQGRTRATSSFRKYQFLGSNRDKGRFFSWRDNKVTKVPIIPLGGEREKEREGEGGEESYINLRIIAEFFHNPTLFYSDTLLNTLSPISVVVIGCTYNVQFYISTSLNFMKVGSHKGNSPCNSSSHNPEVRLSPKSSGLLQVNCCWHKSLRQNECNRQSVF